MRAVSELGRVVRAARRERGWSQVELGERTGWRQGEISRLEAGRFAKLDVRRVEPLLEALGRELVVREWVEVARAPWGVEALDVDPRTLSREALIARFPGKADAVSDMGLAAATLLWLHGAIARGEEPPVSGNLRTIWYRYLKPVLGRLPGVNRAAGATVLSRALGRLTGEGRLTYRSLGLTDPFWEQRRIGTARPGVIVYAEHVGWFRHLMRLHKAIGVTVSCWQGVPNGVTSEYTAAHVLAALKGRRRVRLIALCDWDPAGDMIMGAFADDLVGHGLDVELNFRVVRPELFTAEERRRTASPVPLGGGQRALADAWLARTGGTGGELLRLTSHQLPWERMAPVIQAVACDYTPRTEA